MTSYLTSIDTFSLSRTVFDIFDFEVFRVWPWLLTFEDHWWSNILSLFESPYMTSYLTSIDTFALSRTVFEIFEFKVFRVWPWPLTFRGHQRSKVFWPSEVTRGQKKFIIRKPIHDFLSNFYWHFRSISYRFRDIQLQSFQGLTLTFDLWRSPGVKIFSPFESSCMTSYLTSIDISSLSRTVSEIFDFEVFWVWPWPLTFRGHQRSKIFSPFESLYMTSYLTSIDTFSLSRTVFEIFNFKVFKVWPWPLTFRSHLGSKIFSLFESPCMTSYLTSIDIFSLSRTVFEKIRVKIFRVKQKWRILTFSRSGSLTNIFHS